MDALREAMAVVGVADDDVETNAIMEMDNPLWRPLTEEAETRRRHSVLSVLPRIEKGHGAA